MFIQITGTLHQSLRMRINSVSYTHLSCFYAFFLISSCYRMLETCRVCGVTGDRNINAFFPHDSNTFTYIVCSIAVYFGTKSVRVSDSLNFFQFSCIIIIFCLNICKSVNSGNDLCSIFSKTVQDYTQRFLTNLVCFLSDTDCTDVYKRQVVKDVIANVFNLMAAE